MTDRTTKSQPESHSVECVLEQAVRLLVEAAHPQQIILFGSHARGEQTEESDIDLLVIEGQGVDRFGEMVRLRRVLLSIPMPIDVLVYSEDDVRERGHWLGTALHEALTEGRVLYAAA